MSRRRRAMLSACLILIASLGLAGVSQSATVEFQTESGLIREALSAVDEGRTDAELEQLQTRIERALSDVAWRVGPGKPTYRRAYKLHRVLHRNYFKRYDINVDALDRVVTDGSFNCLSAVLMTGLAAQRLGFEVRIVEYPGHLVLEVDTKSGPVIIEATTPFGFDSQPTRFRRNQDGNSFGSAWLRAGAERSWRVPLSAAVGFTWLNRAWRSFDEGRTLEAVGFVENAAQLVDDLSDHVDAAPRLLARAFVREYDAGRFTTAFRIAELDARLRPGRVTTEDRLLAAAQKRLEQLCLEGRLAEAIATRERLAQSIRDEQALVRFDRTTGPTIVAAAVRLGSWEVADRFVERYRVSEPDLIESQRLQRWVDSRQHPDSEAISQLPWSLIRP